MAEGREVILMNRNRVVRSVKRIAYQIAENNRNDKDIILIGIESRGYIFALELSKILSSINNTRVPCLTLTEKMLKDEAKFDTANVDLHESYTVIVDDVIFSGRTMFRALTLLADINFDELHTAVLVDRGHRKYPLEAQFVGMELARKLDEHVGVKVKEEQISHVVLEMA